MNELQTIGQEYHKGFAVKVLYTEKLEIIETDDKSLYQILYIDEGSVVVGDNDNEKILITPVLLCLNYFEKQKPIHLSNAKGFSIFFKPEAINHGLIGSEVTAPVGEAEDYLATEQLLIYPFKKSNKDNPVNLPVNGSVRERLLRMATDINAQFNKQPDDYWPCRGRSFLIEMLMLLQSMYKLQMENSIEVNTSNKVLNPVLKEIHLSYCDPSFTVANLSQKELIGKGFQKLKFLYSFKKTTGDSPAAYLQKLRISVGCNLLKNTMLKVAEIARRSGYNDEERFSTVFIKLNKITPLAYRAQYPNPYG